MKTFILLLLLSFTPKLWAVDSSLGLKKWEQRPLLTVVLVIDQFRADYLTRLSSRFLPAQKGPVLGGFKFLMEKGAYFPFAQYPTFQSMTCPGHAILLTGALPAANGIPLNEWWDRKLGKMVYCAENEKGELSPERLRTSTVGDELKLVSPKSKTISIAIKDRAAMMLAGHKADQVLWFDRKTSQWATSPYYAAKIPAWAEKANSQLPELFKNASRSNSHSSTLSANDALATSLGTKITLDLAQAAVHEEKLGQRNVPDILTISLSNHDFSGHMHGFGSPETDALTLDEDQRISDFLNQLKRELGSLDRLVVVLSADHGIAPAISEAQKVGLTSGKVDLQKVLDHLESETQKRFGKSQDKYWVGKVYFHFYLNPKLLVERNLNSNEILAVAAESLKGWPGLEYVFTKSLYDQNLFPQGLLGQQLKNQYVPGISGDLIFVPQSFFMDVDENLVTHITGYSYDREVPLILFGSNIKAGVRPDNVDILRLAPTLSFMLGTVSPASSEAKILNLF